MLLFGEKDQSKQRSDALTDVPTPPGVEYETKLGNISGLRLCPSRFEDCRTDHPPMSGFFLMGIPVHSRQSGSLDLNFESGLLVDNIYSFQNNDELLTE